MAVSAATEEEKTKKRRRTRSLKSCLAVEANRSIHVYSCASWCPLRLDRAYPIDVHLCSSSMNHSLIILNLMFI